MLLLGLSAGPAEAARVFAQQGDLFYIDDAGKGQQLTADRLNAAPVLSPDGKSVLYIHAVPLHAGSDPYAEPKFATELRLFDPKSGQSRLLLASRPDADPQKSLEYFASPLFSLDGKSIYFLSRSADASTALHRLELASGAEQYLGRASAVGLITRGKYAGHLVVQTRKVRGERAIEEFWLIDGEGREERRIGTSVRQVELFIRSAQ